MFIVVAILYIVLFSAARMNDTLVYVGIMASIFSVGVVYGLESIALAIRSLADMEKKKDAWSKDSSGIYSHNDFVDDCR